MFFVFFFPYNCHQRALYTHYSSVLRNFLSYFTWENRTPHLSLPKSHSEKAAMETDADTDVTMVPANTEPEAEPASSSSALLAASSSSSSSFKKNNKRFEIKKWNAVSLWAWGYFSYQFSLLYLFLFLSEFGCLICWFCLIADIVVDNCAICRNHIMDLCMYPLILSFLFCFLIFWVFF